jgi:hypothetical protein
MVARPRYCGRKGEIGAMMSVVVTHSGLLEDKVVQYA